jgi:hypothetical protein
VKKSDVDKLNAVEEDAVRIIKGFQERQDGIAEVQRGNESVLDARIQESEELLARIGADLPDRAAVNRTEQQLVPVRRPALRSWDELVEEARQRTSEPVTFADVLTGEEIDDALYDFAGLNKAFEDIHRLDAADIAIAGSAGLLAALVDILLVTMPKHSGFLGGKGSEGGALSNYIREKMQGNLPPEQLKKLEQEFDVPYDPSTSAGLDTPVPGLGPGTHRYQSLGHGPVLGFIFGVRDILLGEFTAIDKNGNLIRQAVSEPAAQGLNIFQAIARVAQHNFKTDLPTSAGLPAPLMPLAQFLQFGSFGNKDYTIGQISRQMYRQHYDFAHFAAMSIPTLMIEVIVRLGYLVKRLYEGHGFMESLPVGAGNRMKKPKLQTMLFFAHTVATAANAGKVYFTGSPLAINYPQWLAFFRYALPQLKWALFDKERERFKYVQTHLDQRWDQLDQDLDRIWSEIFPEPVVLRAVE